jgi:hypothetical protein
MGRGAGQVELSVLSLASRVYYGRPNDEALRAAFPPAHVPVRYRPARLPPTSLSATGRTAAGPHTQPDRSRTAAGPQPARSRPAAGP